MKWSIPHLKFRIQLLWNDIEQQVVQANGGLLPSGHSKEEEERRRIRIKNQLINGGIEKDDAEKYMADSFYSL